MDNHTLVVVCVYGGVLNDIFEVESIADGQKLIAEITEGEAEYEDEYNNALYISIKDAAIDQTYFYTNSGDNDFYIWETQKYSNKGKLNFKIGDKVKLDSLYHGIITSIIPSAFNKNKQYIQIASETDETGRFVMGYVVNTNELDRLVKEE
ncbi:MAG: hypothetical protein WC476_01660 [Phycisphaerae bacterium]|jgi:hypothetical protein